MGEPLEGEIPIDHQRCLRAYEDLLKHCPRSLSYFEQYAAVTGRVLGPAKATALWEKVLRGEYKFSMSQGERLRLQAAVEKMPGATPKVTQKPAVARGTVCVRGIYLGMPRNEVEHSLGNPVQVSTSYPTFEELYYPEDSKGILEWSSS